jgi:hypothetical protein
MELKRSADTTQTHVPAIVDVDEDVGMDVGVDAHGANPARTQLLNLLSSLTQRLPRLIHGVLQACELPRRPTMRRCG